MRHAQGAPNAAALEAAKGAATAAARAGKKRSVRGVSDAAFADRVDEVSAMLAGGRFEEAQGIHFVALYADLHFRVYGAASVDLGPKERVFAARLAEEMLAKDFEGDRGAMARFVAWTWSREKGREDWRRQNHKPGGRVTWRAQFGRGLLSDYRVEEARKKASR